MCIRPGQRGASSPQEPQAERQRTGGSLAGAKVGELGGWEATCLRAAWEGRSVCFCLGSVCRELIPPERAEAPRAQESEAALGSDGDGGPVTTKVSLLGAGVWRAWGPRPEAWRVGHRGLGFRSAPPRAKSSDFHPDLRPTVLSLGH